MKKKTGSFFTNKRKDTSKNNRGGMKRDEKREMKLVETKAVESNRNQRESRKAMENSKAAPAPESTGPKLRSVSKMEEQDCLRV